LAPAVQKCGGLTRAVIDGHGGNQKALLGFESSSD
jgi:hypothetical protein